MTRMRLAGIVVTVCIFVTGVWVSSAGASGAPQGPPAGPTTGPFTQCPAIGLDTACQFLVDITSANPASAPIVLQDPAQGYYDGSDDVTVAIQNDTAAAISGVHLGVAGTNDGSFGFDGDGLCSPPSGPAPDGCPFGPPGNNSDPFNYFGPDTTLTPDAGTTDAGNVAFTTPLAPGQYTYISLEAQLSTPIVYAGTGNTGIRTSLTASGATGSPGPVISSPTPINATDTATIVGPKASTATGTVTYKLYTDSNCTALVGGYNSPPKPVSGGVASASDPVGKAPLLSNNRAYYWQVTYSGDKNNSSVVSACGNEVMTFGTPPGRFAASVSSTLSGGGQAGTNITVPPNTPVTDTATVSAAGGQVPNGRVTYFVYSRPTCSNSSQIQGAGGGLTSGSGPASNPLSLPTGTYYFVATYSGNATVAPASSACGAAILTVTAAGPPPPPPPPPPSSAFTSLGKPSVNKTTGAITVRAAFPTTGLATVSGVVLHGATLGRAVEAKKKKCKKGFIRKAGKCVDNRPVRFGTTSVSIPGAKTVAITIRPSSRVMKALKRGKRVSVSVTTRFQNSAGGAAVSHVQSTSVKLKKAKKK